MLRKILGEWILQNALTSRVGLAQESFLLSVDGGHQEEKPGLFLFIK